MKYSSFLFLLVTFTTIYAQRPCRNNCKDLIGEGPCATRGCLTTTDLFYCQKTCKGCTLCRAATPPCSPTCRDTIRGCGILSLHCHRRTQIGIKTTFFMCKSTCQVCTECAKKPEILPECKSIQECRNVLRTETCERNSHLCGSSNMRFTQRCQRTCGMCQVCDLPPVEIPCTHTCRDINPTVICTRNKRLCGDSYPLFTTKCQKTCGECKLCEPTEPTPLECEECEDKRPSCEYWTEQGYCDPRNGYPNVITTCPLSCGQCQKCPEEIEDDLEEDSKLKLVSIAQD